MGRIKQGLDYFPLNTNFMHDRLVRRVMKREGDASFTILIHTLSHIYSGEGYYVRADSDFFDELSDQLFTVDNERVRRVIHLFVEYGFFDSPLYERHGILTSADIQQQFLFITKRRSRRHIAPEYCLLPEEEEEHSPADTVYKKGDTVYKNTDTVYKNPDTAYNEPHIKRKEKEKKENILPNPPSAEGGDEEGGGDFLGDKPSAKKKRELSQEDIDRMQVPADGCKRNFQGLLESLRLHCIPPSQQYAIVRKSNYGEIGHKVWKGLSVLRSSGGKIKLPGHYLLSLLK